MHRLARDETQTDLPHGEKESPFRLPRPLPLARNARAVADGGSRPRPAEARRPLRPSAPFPPGLLSSPNLNVFAGQRVSHTTSRPARATVVAVQRGARAPVARARAQGASPVPGGEAGAARGGRRRRARRRGRRRASASAWVAAVERLRDPIVAELRALDADALAWTRAHGADGFVVRLR